MRLTRSMNSSFQFFFVLAQYEKISVLIVSQVHSSVRFRKTVAFSSFLTKERWHILAQRFLIVVRPWGCFKSLFKPFLLPEFFEKHLMRFKSVLAFIHCVFFTNALLVCCPKCIVFYLLILFVSENFDLFHSFGYTLLLKWGLIFVCSQNNLFDSRILSFFNSLRCLLDFFKRLRMLFNIRWNLLPKLIDTNFKVFTANC